MTKNPSGSDNTIVIKNVIVVVPRPSSTREKVFKTESNVMGFVPRFHRASSKNSGWLPNTRNGYSPFRVPRP